MPKTVDQAYKQRLSDWVESQLKDRDLSQREFAALMGFSLGTIQYWMGRKIKGPLSQECIDAIAAYRGMASEDVKAWLEGREPREVLPLDEKIKQLEKRVQLLEEKHGMADLQGFYGPGAVVNLIRYEIAHQGFDPDDPSGLQEFLMCLPTVDDDKVAAIKELIQKRTERINDDIQLFAIALALSAFTGGFYNLQMLQMLDSSANGRHVKQS